MKALIFRCFFVVSCFCEDKYFNIKKDAVVGVFFV